MILFNEPYICGMEQVYMQSAFQQKSFQSGGNACQMLAKRMADFLNCEGVFPVHSCTAALEIVALALDIHPGDEVIMPSYTYVSTANAFALRGATIVFVDINPATMCLDLDGVVTAITDKTKVVVPVHYGGVSCDMDRLMALAEQYQFFVVEDAAQSIHSYYKGRHLGTIGHFGCISCHETKNIHAAGQGGLLIVSDKRFHIQVNQILERGTNRDAFLQGNVQEYTWQTLGSAYGMPALNALFYASQLQGLYKITTHRKAICKIYRSKLFFLKDKYEQLQMPDANKDNGHMFYIKLSNQEERQALQQFLASKDIESASHYEPLHQSDAGKKYGVFRGHDLVTSKDAKRLLRLPVHNNMTLEDATYVAEQVKVFLSGGEKIKHEKDK